MDNKKIKTILNCEFCKNKPCLIGCPLDNDIPTSIKYIQNNKYEKAYETFLNTTILMSICGRICPQSNQCEGSCIKKGTKELVKIGNIEEFIGDYGLENNLKDSIPIDTKHNVAVVGSGPSGLTCAYFLRKMGIGVTIFEKYDYLGGLLIHGIPSFRLPKEIVNNVISRILSSGIEVKYKMELGKNLKLDELLKKYDAIYLGIGANVPNKLHINGEKLNGVYGGNTYLEKNINVELKDKVVIVIGGGDVAMDVSRTIAKHNPKKVIIMYRKSKKDMRANDKEIENAKKEGIEFMYYSTVIKINGRKKVNSVTYLDKKNNENKMNCDYVFTAIGSHPENFIKKLNINLNPKGKVSIKRGGFTSNPKIFAGGDVAGVKSTVAWAARSGRDAAYSIYDFLNNKVDKS